MSTETQTVPDESTAYILNLLARASADHRQAITEVESDLDEHRSAPFRPPTYAQRFTDLLAAAAKINAFMEAVQATAATAEQITVARASTGTAGGVYFRVQAVTR